MRAHVQYLPEEGAFGVKLFERAPGDGAYVYRLVERLGRFRLERVEVPWNELPEERDRFTYVIPEDAFEALIRAGAEHVKAALIATDVTVDALHDARGTRDRLLGLVEAAFEARA